MTIYDDIARVGAPEVDAPEATIGADFFLRSFDIPEATPPQVQEARDPLSNWQDEVNRAFMRGCTADEILSAMGRALETSPKRQEIQSYVKKYEGLIGTVFLDSGAIARGFPMTLIPRRYRPFNMFAINCPSYHTVVKRSISGGVGGSIESFMNTVDGIKEETEDVCSLTNLPVLREGMFTEEVISSLLKKLGKEGHTLRELRDAMVEQVVKCESRKEASPQETQTPDMHYGLRQSDMTVEAQAAIGESKVSMETTPLQDSTMNNLMDAIRDNAPELDSGASYGLQEADVVMQEPTAFDDSLDYNLRPPSMEVDEQSADDIPDFEMGGRLSLEARDS